ncbi:MAG: tetratricopeptide repeat protein [Spirochaetia bacterium]|nr:tetratricopeptide repeat protein [Spirochaetia bacterium]
MPQPFLVTFRITFSCAALLLAADCARTDFNEEELKRFEAAQGLFRDHKFEDASAAAKALWESRPGNVEAGVLYAKSRFYVRDFPGAESILRTSLKKDESNPYLLMWLGRTLLAQGGRCAEASQIFQSILKRDPENYMAHYHMGICLEEDRKLKLALGSYTQALAVEYEVSKVHVHMARMFSALGMHDRAEKHAARVRTLAVNESDVAAVQGLKDGHRSPAVVPQKERKGPK